MLSALRSPTVRTVAVLLADLAVTSLEDELDLVLSGAVASNRFSLLLGWVLRKRPRAALLGHHPLLTLRAHLDRPFLGHVSLAPHLFESRSRSPVIETVPTGQGREWNPDPYESRRSADETRRTAPSSRFGELVDGWLFQLGATKPAANTLAAYRRDLEGVARRIAADAEVAVLHLEHLTKEALRAAFASWVTDHAGASVLRAHSSWSRFFDFLVAEDLVEGNPTAAVPKPRRVDGAPRSIRDPDAAARLLGTSAKPDPRGRDPWP